MVALTANSTLVKKFTGMRATFYSSENEISLYWKLISPQVSNLLLGS